ncbi:MAG: UDP-glucuronic acid decarboxylase family protein [Actinomycetota bacterium]
MVSPPFERVVITGGAGFIGSHLCERFLAEGADVLCVDNLLTGRPKNVEHLFDEPRFRFVGADVSDGIQIEEPVDAVLHFASPASPSDYLRLPIETLKVGALGTHNALGLAKSKGARFLLASTSEVYGDPMEHPQREEYWGNVNPVGPRGVYDEAKRYAEALVMAYRRAHGMSTRIARIFNTIGERMRPDDGRAVPTFITQSLRGEPITVHGDGTQTRSVGYISDLVEGIWLLLHSDVMDPVNLGIPEEVSVLDLAKMVIRICGAGSDIRFVGRPVDDPTVRRPDITRARSLLGWEPRVPLEEALERTVAWFRTVV